MTDSDLTKYDWRRRLGDGGSGDYLFAVGNLLVTGFISTIWSRQFEECRQVDRSGTE